MRAFNQYNPVAAAVCLIGAAVIPMFCLNPVMFIVSLVCAVAVNFTVSGPDPKKLIFPLVMLAVVSVANPLFNHRGSTALFFINGNPVTLESFFYGVLTGVALAALILWFSAFSAVMTTDKLLYLFGRISPKTAFMLSMVLRFVPMFKRQAKRTSAAQTVTGKGGEESFSRRLATGSRVFSVIVSWALENGIITADSMQARGYASGRRSRYAIFRFLKRDFVLIAAAVILILPCIAALTGGGLEMSFYPEIQAIPTDYLSLSAYASYAVLCILPLITQATEGIKWKYSRSKIYRSDILNAHRMR